MATITNISFSPAAGSVTITVTANFTEIGSEPLSARIIGNLKSVRESIRVDYSNYDSITANGTHQFIIPNVDVRRFPIGDKITYDATLILQAAKSSGNFVREKTIFPFP